MTNRNKTVKVQLIEPVEMAVQLSAVHVEEGVECAWSSCHLALRGIEIILNPKHHPVFEQRDNRQLLFKLESACCETTVFQTHHNHSFQPTSENRSFILRTLCCEARVDFGQPVPAPKSPRDRSPVTADDTSTGSQVGKGASRVRGWLKNLLDRHNTAVKRLAAADTFRAVEKRIDDLDVQSDELEKGITKPPRST